MREPADREDLAHDGMETGDGEPALLRLQPRGSHQRPQTGARDVFDPGKVNDDVRGAGADGGEQPRLKLGAREIVDASDRSQYQDVCLAPLADIHGRTPVTVVTRLIVRSSAARSKKSQPICGKRPRSFHEFTFSQPAGLGVLVGYAAATATIGKREHGTALGPAPHRLAVAAAPQFLGSRRAAAGARGDRADRLGRHGDERALSDRRGSADQPRPVAAAGIRAAHGAAHGLRARRLAGLQPRLCGARGQEPAGRKDPDPGARHPAIGADPRLSVDHRDRLHRAFPGPAARRRMRRDLRDLHLASLEHDVQRLPVAAHRAGRADRGGADVPPVALAAVLAARSAARHARRSSGT